MNNGGEAKSGHSAEMAAIIKAQTEGQRARVICKAQPEGDYLRAFKIGESYEASSMPMESLVLGYVVWIDSAEARVLSVTDFNRYFYPSPTS